MNARTGGTQIQIAALVERGREMAARQAAAEPQELRRSPDVIARLLGERGFWSLTPGAHGDAGFEVEDLGGRLEVVPSTNGPCGMREALVFASLTSLWADGPRKRDHLETSIHRIAEQAGFSWSGRSSALILEALEVLRLTGYRFVVEGATSGRSKTFTLLSELETAWEGAPTSPRRRIRIAFDPVVADWLDDRKNIRPIDGAVLRALGPQRELARRLFLLLEVHGAGGVEGGRESLNRLIDDRLAGSLGTTMPLKKLVPALRRAAKAIEETAPRYESVQVVPRESHLIEPGGARYLIRATRMRAALVRPQKP